MSITKKELRQIIKEEVLKELRRIDEYTPQYTGVPAAEREPKADGLMPKIKADLKALQEIESGGMFSRAWQNSKRSQYFKKIIHNGQGFESLKCGLGGCQNKVNPPDISDFWIGTYQPKRKGNVYNVYAVSDMAKLPLDKMGRPLQRNPIDLQEFEKML